MSNDVGVSYSCQFLSHVVNFHCAVLCGHYKLVRNLEMHVLSVGGLGVRRHVGGMMSVLYFRVTLNLRCDCGCGPIHFAACSLGGCVYLGMFDNVCASSGCQLLM